MSHICKNCGNTFEGNYCNNCGQAAHTHDINAKYIWHDVQHGLFHYDKGVVYTLGQLLLKPGTTVREYIEGKRTRHFAPISLVIVMATLYGGLYHSLHINTFRFSHSEGINFENLNEVLSHHYSLFTLVTIPFYALFSYLVFKKQGYGFSEHIVLNAFLASQRLCLSVIALPFFHYAKSHKDISLITGIVLLLSILLAYRGFSEFFNRLPKWKSFLLTTLCYITTIIVMSIIAALLLTLINL